MPQYRTSRRLLALAVTAALTAAAGTFASAPATAVPAGAPHPAAMPATRLPRIAPDLRIVSAGPSGFLTTDRTDRLTWTAYADGARTLLGTFRGPRAHGGASDAVAELHGDDQTVTVHRGDRSGEWHPRLRELGLHYVGAFGGYALVAASPDRRELHVVTADAVNRIVEGVSSPAAPFTVQGISDDAVLVRSATRVDGELVWRDTAVDRYGRVLGSYRVWPSWGAASLSDRHVVWSGRGTGDQATIRVAVLGDRHVQRRELGDHGVRLAGLVGEWLVSGRATALGKGGSQDHALYAARIEGGPGNKLLDHTTSVAPGPDGTVLAMGGTVERGEGLYRISRGSDGTPVARLVATTGQPTRLTLLKSNVPSRVNLDDLPEVPLEWQLSRSNANVRVVVRHNATGSTTRIAGYDLIPVEEQDENPGWFDGYWEHQLIATRGKPRTAPNGAYTWHLTARPKNGIGPDLTASGSFVIKRRAAPHDFTNDGTPDLLGRTSDGELLLENTYHSPDGVLEPVLPAERRGGGWGRYSSLAVAGDAVGGPAADLLARDKEGVLWVHPGKGDGTFATRIRIGGGWNTYDRLTAGADHTGDGHADLLARDRAGVLWLYQGTGSADAPYRTRRRISGGWGAYDMLTATPDLGGSAAGDLVARDVNGVLWLYLGRSDGTFASRVRVGSGWHRYTAVIGWGDANRDGNADLYAREANGTGWVYHGTSDPRAPFETRTNDHDYLGGHNLDGVY
ncbi:VCBS repeat-containing protein [Streptomyces sp. NPDC101132]|uniref:VCBS repeat-containing protein n=1 Tax=Streptomyces sp. NPDC101132 TaxID=3366110 RepID=UPI003817D0B5